MYYPNIPYQTQEELEEKIASILSDIHQNADLYHTFARECSIFDTENENRHWG